MMRTNAPFRIAKNLYDERELQPDGETPRGSNRTRVPLESLAADLGENRAGRRGHSSHAGHRQAGDLWREDAAARELANRLSLSRKRRFKVRHRQLRSADAGRSVFPEELVDQENYGSRQNLVRLAGMRLATALHGMRRRWIPGLCAGLLIVLLIQLALYRYGPSNNISLARIGSALGETDANRTGHFDMLLEIEKIRENVATNIQPPSPDRSTATTSFSKIKTIQPLPEVTITPKNDAPAPIGSVVIDSHINLTASAGEDTKRTGETAVDLNRPDGTVDIPTPVKNEDRLQSLALSGSGTVEPMTLERLPSTPPITNDESVSDGAQPAAQYLSIAMVERLLERGEVLLRSGDIVSARLMFLSAAEAGDLRGAWGVGMTYDPEVFAILTVNGVEPDREQAEFWYRTAGDSSAFMTIDEKVVDEPDAGKAKADDRNAACARKYKSFNAKTGLYKSYRGEMRPCRLP